MAGNLHVLVFGNEFCLTLSQKPLFLRICSKSLENTGGKGEVAREKQFLLFPQYLPPFWRTFCHFYYFKVSSANSFSLEESKICHLGKGYLNPIVINNNFQLGPWSFRKV